MIANALLATTAILLGVGFWLMEECRFLIPYRRLLFGTYGGSIALFATALFLNLFAVFYIVFRKVFLKDTGRKLAHLEKQLRTGDSISEELTARLREESDGSRY
jgi:hypothetical protein